ncbi:MAG: hypothetical protein KTR32_09160 [Granulosicoccus sp.]|nr:hypothetical protein [Granulosicoccus sp.]
MNIEIFTSRDCHYCKLAKELLKTQSLKFKEVNISDDVESEKMLLNRLPRVRSLPQLFVDGRHVGGYEDLKLMIEKGDLGTTGGVV